MNKLFAIIGICTILFGCAGTKQIRSDAVSEQSRSQMTSASASGNIRNPLPTGWNYQRTDNLPFEIALPQNASITSTISKYRSHDLVGVDIESHPSASDPAIWAHVPDFFSFTIGRLSAYTSIDDFLNSICLPEGRQSDKPYYKISDRWRNAGIEFAAVSRWFCEPPYAAFGSGVAIDYNNNLFVIFLPPGDWGSEGAKYFNIALHSIRPVSESSSSNGG